MSEFELEKMFEELEKKIEEKPEKEEIIEPKKEKIEMKIPEEKPQKSDIQPPPAPIIPELKPSQEKPLPEVTEDTSSPKEVYLIYGDKGQGKTTLAFSFPGEIACMSFDRKSSIIKETRYKNDKRIHVFDIVKFMNYYDANTLTESAAFTYDYMLKVLNYIKNNLSVDWIIIDGSEIFHQIAEWTMRYRHGISAFEGFSNLNLWKERRILIRQIHNMCLDIAKKGLIYTTYQENDEIIVQGELVTKKKIPKWIDVLVFETDYVIHVDVSPSGNYIARIVTSKNDNKLPSGRVFDITNKSLFEVIKK